MGDKMASSIVLLVLLSALMHPIWNLMIKQNPDPQLGFLFLNLIMALCAFVHGVTSQVDFSSVLTVLPVIGISVFGQTLYGTCLTATLKRGELSAYYPIIRSSPIFVVLVSLLFIGQRYPFAVLIGIALAVLGGFLLLYRRGSRILENKRSLGFALIAMCGTGIYSLADAHMMQDIEAPVLVFFIQGSMVLIYSITWLRQREVLPDTTTSLPNSRFSYFVLPGLLAYSSYYLILTAYQQGGEVAAVTSIRQASIPISVALGGLFLREGAMVRRFFASGLLALGIIIIALSG